MIRGIPGRTAKIRLVERVRTVDPQYNIYDVGIQHSNGDIDSIAVGGSFATAKRWLAEADERALRNEGTTAAEAQLAADEHAIENDLPFINIDGTDVPEKEQRKVATTV